MWRGLIRDVGYEICDMRYAMRDNGVLECWKRHGYEIWDPGRWRHNANLRAPGRGNPIVAPDDESRRDAGIRGMKGAYENVVP